MAELLEFLKTHGQFRRTRLPALYSDFRALQILNPDGFAANVEAWKNGLAGAAKEGYFITKGVSTNLLVLNVDESLMNALETKEWGRPLALGVVLRDAIGKKEMIPLQSYMDAKESIYQSSWIGSPWRLVSWGLRQFGLTDGHRGDDRVPVGKLVIVSNVEDAAREVLRRLASHTSRVDKIYSKEMFYREYGNVLTNKHVMSHEDLAVLLTYLSRDKRLIDYNGQTIKFKSHSDAHPPSITQEDSSIASLKNLMFDIEKQVETLAARIEKLTITARDAVSRKNRVVAIAALRTKKIVESHLIKQSEVLVQLEEVYSKIGEATDQVELVRIMEGSTGVLKSLHREMGGIERVDDVVDQLKEQMTQVDEVGNVLSEISQSGGAAGIDLDDELEALELEGRDNSEAESLSYEAKGQQQASEREHLFGVSERKIEMCSTEPKKTPEDGRVAEELVEESSKSLQQLLL